MPEFKVTLERKAAQYAETTVEAVDPDQAEAIAISKYDRGELEWELGPDLGYPQLATVEEIKPESIELEPFEKEQLIELLANANGDYTSMLVKLTGLDVEMNLLRKAALSGLPGQPTVAMLLAAYVRGTNRPVAEVVRAARLFRADPTVSKALPALKLALLEDPNYGAIPL